MKSDSERSRRAQVFGAGDTEPPPLTVPATSASWPRTSVLPQVERESGQIVSPERPRYEPLQHLGTGGVGTVELALDNDIGRRVAVKRLLPELSRPSDVLRFTNEVRTVGMLEHPNIAPIHDVGVDNQGQYFFVMKHVEGETLEGSSSDRCRRCRGTRKLHVRSAHANHSWRAAGTRVRARARRDPSRHQACQRDDRSVRRGDAHGLGPFGPQRNRVDPPESLSGTPAYIAPEQVRGEKFGDERSDVYGASACSTSPHAAPLSPHLHERARGHGERRESRADPGSVRDKPASEQRSTGAVVVRRQGHE